MEAVKEDGRALYYVPDEFKTPELYMEAVKSNGLALKSVKKQTPEICMEAVKDNGYALEYVKKQTPEICMEAVRQNGYSLEYIKEQTPEMCIEAVRQEGWAFRYVKEQTKEIALEAAISLGNDEKVTDEEWDEFWTKTIDKSIRDEVLREYEEIYNKEVIEENENAVVANDNSELSMGDEEER